jgi:Na+-transporting NADH:ubiquinone oxidoreductase subunit C
LFGFISIGDDGNTVKGITFYKHKETPGLGGEVDKKWFQNNFIGKEIFNNDDLVSIKIAKGVSTALPEKDWNHAVDGITGATMTSQGLTNFLLRDLQRYENFLREVYGK